MKIADLISPARVIAGLDVTSKARCLAELARGAAAETRLPQQAIQDALAAREALGSTGVGSGIAIPHAQVPGLTRAFAQFVRLAEPIDYDAIDDRPVDLVFLLLLPASGREHLQALAGVMRRLRADGAAAELRRAADAREIYELLVRDGGGSA